MLFCAARRTAEPGLYRELAMTEASKRLGVEWRALPDAARAGFRQQAAAAKAAILKAEEEEEEEEEDDEEEDEDGGDQSAAAAAAAEVATAAAAAAAAAQGEAQFEVEAVVARRLRRGVSELKVQWVGFGARPPQHGL